MKINFFKFLTRVLSFYFLNTDERIRTFNQKNAISSKIIRNKKTIIFLPYRFNHSTIWFEFLTASYFKLKGYNVLVLFAGKTITISDGINYKTRFSWIKEKINIGIAYAYSKRFNVRILQG